MMRASFRGQGPVFAAAAGVVPVCGVVLKGIDADD
jgi:hypothetical protein